MPKLISVAYRLFKGEESSLLSAVIGETHDFGGELVLGFQEGRKLFVSWVNEPIQYSVGAKDLSHFVADANLSEHDVSATSMWTTLVDQEITFRFLTRKNQILEIASKTGRVFACSFEHGGWQADALTICKQIPSTDDTE